jgi:hypothetical protein
MDESEIRAMIEATRDYAAEHDGFDESFVDSCEEQLDERGWLSDTQVQALRNICDGFRIEY